MKTTVILAACAALALSACSHTYQFKADEKVQPSSARTKLAGRTLALDFSGVPQNYVTKANGHSFAINDVRGSNERFVRKVFANERITEDRGSADYVLKLTLDLNLGAAIGGTRCDVRARWDILQGGKVAGTSTVSDSSAFPAMANGGRNCELASLRAVSKGLDEAMARF